MLEKVHKMEERFREIDDLLARPDVLRERTRLIELSRERRELEPVVAKSRELRGILQRITLHRVRPHFYAIDPSVQWHITSTLEPRWMAARV